MDKILRFLHIGHKVVKDEVKEIANLKISEKDQEQADKLADIAVVALTQYGVVLPAVAKPIIAKAIAYGIRDVKDGINAPQKLIIGRIISEIKNNK